ncbi:MAG: HD domain-containing protein [Chloroflexia bacterium]
MQARTAYRLAQLRSSLQARSCPSDREWAVGVLSDAERTFFERMPPWDRAHSLRVARVVQRDGGDELLTRAALLHDCGKTLPGRGVPLLYRGGLVVLGALSPRLLRLAARRWGPLWPIYLHVHHPDIGAELLSDAGSPSDVVGLVRRHQSPAADPRLRCLQRADEGTE